MKMASKFRIATSRKLRNIGDSMDFYCNLIEGLVWGFIVTLVISPFVISLIRREKVK